MALFCRTFISSCRYSRHITKPVKWNVQNYSVRFTSSEISCRELNKYLDVNYQYRPVRNYSTLRNSTPTSSSSDNDNKEAPKDEPPKKETLFQRLKFMYKNYWYVVVPVHIVTSGIWFGALYYIVRSGLDVISLLESLGISQKIIAPLRDSKAGYVALTLPLYKLVAPLRYMTTLGVTTYAIRKLTTLGWIKPVPSKERIKKIIKDSKDNMQVTINKHYQVQKDRKNQVLEEMRRYKHDIKTRIKKM